MGHRSLSALFSWNALRSPDNGLRRLRWILVPVILCDTAMTLLGQPASYWVRHESGAEYNQFFAWFLFRGPSFFVLTSLLYVLGALLLATLLPRRLALAVLLAYVLGHYMGACTWIIGAFGFGMWLPVTYAGAIGLGMAALGLDVKE